MKKLLLLGGLRYLIPVIESAKGMGHYVITCDYLPDNIAHQYSDEYHNVSILDKEAVLSLAKSLQIDGIMSFAVDPGVVTAAYVAEKMGLPSAGSLASIEILQDKGLFRAFLEANNFNVPKAKSFDVLEEALEEYRTGPFPLMVKPVDAAGSKGVSKVSTYEELKPAIDYALQFTQRRNFIIEAFIASKGFSSDTDCFSIDGKLVVTTFSSQRFDKQAPNPYTPSAYSWPSSISAENQAYLTRELQRIITLLDLQSSVYNVEVREGLDGTPYIMEMSPRGGGNRLSEMIRYGTGIDLIKRAVQAALGETIDTIDQQPIFDGYWAEVILYSNVSGKYQDLIIDRSIQDNIVEVDVWVNKEDRVQAFSAANHAIGTVVLRFQEQGKMEKVLANYGKYFQIIVS